MSRGEKFWWCGLALWGSVVLLWWPAPPVLFTSVPSVVSEPSGHRIFFDLVKKDAKKVSRTLKSPKSLSEETDALVLLNPSRGLERDVLSQLKRWVKNGGTLIVGHPIYNKNGEEIDDVLGDTNIATFKSNDFEDSKLVSIKYVSDTENVVRDVDDFSIKIGGELIAITDETEVLAMSDDERIMATADKVGVGLVIQLASSTLLDNKSIGFKRSHLFAAAIIDRVGRDMVWVFDESNEGVNVQPALAPMLGTVKARAVFLHLILVVFFWYWWKSATIANRKLAKSNTRLYEITANASKVGGFYLRAKKGEWALSWYLKYFKWHLKHDNQEHIEQAEIEALIASATEQIEQDSSVDNMVKTIKKMSSHIKNDG